jgi:hypothetical protein
LGARHEKEAKMAARADVTRPAAVIAAVSQAGRLEVEDLRAKVASLEAELAGRAPASS